MSSPDDSALIQIENSTIKCSKVKKKTITSTYWLNKLKFDIVVETVCKIFPIKLGALSRITN